MSDETLPDPISPELALVDPELARGARERLPLPGTSYRPRWVPRDRRPPAAADVPSHVDVGRPTGRPAPVRAGARLLAVAALAPAAVALALIADFHESGGQPLPGSPPTNRETSARSARPPRQAAPAPRRRARASGRAQTGRPAKRARHSSRAPRWSRRNAVEGVVGAIGSAPLALTKALGRPTARARKGEYCRVSWSRRGLTIVLVARRAKNPCAKGRTVGGVATGAAWRTAKGLHVGASLAQLRRRYPRARAVGSGWWKLGYVRGIRSKARVPLHAHVTRGRVDKILVN